MSDDQFDPVAAFVPVINEGILQVPQAGLILNGNVLNLGDVEVESGAMLVTRAYTQNAPFGVTELVNGTIGGGPFAINSGPLVGSGTIIGDVTNSGQLIPGGLGEENLALTITGNYTQTGAGALNIYLGGTIPVNDYNQLVVSGTASLGGTLSVETSGGFTPSDGDSFQILSAGAISSGFAVTDGLDVGAGFIITQTTHNRGRSDAPCSHD